MLPRGDVCASHMAPCVLGYACVGTRVCACLDKCAHVCVCLHMCAHVCACLHKCAHVCVCVISGSSILFRIFSKPNKHTLLIYPIFHVNFCHVGLFLFPFMRS